MSGGLNIVSGVSSERDIGRNVEFLSGGSKMSMGGSAKFIVESSLDFEGGLLDI